MTGRSGAQVQEVSTWRNIQSVIPPEIREALSNNSLPSPGVLRIARDFRDDPTAFSHVSQRRITDIDRQIKDLQRERSLLADTDNARTVIVEACTKVCAPIRRLPRDILHEIALHALPASPGPVERQAPMSLSHVSSAWRSVVLQTPRLWTDLYLRIKNMDPNSLATYSEIIDTWFGRTASHPINLYLYVECEINGDEALAYNFRIFLEAIAPWMPRVARLGIGSKAWAKLMVQFADIEWDLPNLHTLEFLGQQFPELRRDYGLGKLGAGAHRITMFKSAPRLTTLIANQNITSFPSAFQFLPWRAFVHIIIREGMSHHLEAQSILATNSPNLQSAHLCMNGPPMAPLFPSTMAPELVANLTHLKVDIPPADWSYMPGFFSCFKFESLLNLDIAIDVTSGEFMDDLPPLNIVEAFPSLEVFRLDWGCPLPTVIHLVQMMPRLRILIMTLDHSDLPATLTKLFNALVLSDSQPKILPLLEECSIKSFVYESVLVDTSTILRFLRSRTRLLPPGFANFKKLCMTGSYTFLRDLNKEIARNSTEENLAVDIQLFPSHKARYHDSLHQVQLPTPRFAVIDQRSDYFDIDDHVLD